MPTGENEDQTVQTTIHNTQDCGPDVDVLRAAFLAGFTTGRTGTYFGDLPGISRRAAETSFEQYYKQQFE